jgi:DNA polymerase (family 10)
MTNLEIAELLRDVAAAYQLKDQYKYKFQIIAYERAADATEHATSEFKDLWDDGKLEEVPGIGPSIAEHLSELFKTGHSKHFDDLLSPYPKIMFEFMKVPGIGAKTAYKLVTQLNINSMSQLEEAAKNGKIALLEGFGEDSQKKILKQVQDNMAKKGVVRHLLPYATLVASEVISYLKQNKNVIKIDPLGSLRRKTATVGDIDISVAVKTDEPMNRGIGEPANKDVLDYFTKYPKAQKVIEKGEHSASIIVAGGVQVDLMVQPLESYGSLLQHFTGSKMHNIALREYALKKGMSLSEYGIKMSNDKKSNAKLNIFKTEKELYNYLELEYIEPELREDAGEIEASKNHHLPDLINLGDIKSDLQIHSSFDIETSHDLGESTMEEIIEKGNELGYEYLAFTEHNPSQKGHTDRDITEILKRKKEIIEHINYSIKNMNNKNTQTGSLKRVFNSLEIDMKSDGTLPVPDAGLDLLDFALVSIHSVFDQNRDLQTKRVLQALSHPKVKIFAHPTGRKINEREGTELNWSEIFAFCLKHDKWVEINCDPMRLDLPDMLVRDAVKSGVKITLGTDAHHALGMDNMIWGVNVARRGWCEKKNIVNTFSLSEFEKALNN